LREDTINISNLTGKTQPEADMYYFKTREAFYIDIYSYGKETSPFYYISKLWSTGKGTGTRAVQQVVESSLKDKATRGKVIVNAASMDKKTSPAGFYYKLGFRFKDNKKNKILQKWLLEGGKKKNAPMETGVMYLPKRNIFHCLNYNHNAQEKELFQR